MGNQHIFSRKYYQLIKKSNKATSYKYIALMKDLYKKNKCTKEIFAIDRETLLIMGKGTIPMIVRSIKALRNEINQSELWIVNGKHMVLYEESRSVCEKIEIFMRK
jgi:hypothetical protein